MAWRSSARADPDLIPTWHTGSVPTIDFSKGHGTENDFVIVADPDGQLELSAKQIAALCDRHAGIGADGVLRVVRSQHVGDWTGEPDLWFMDYHNADGSVAEMCGNGVRVFARYLIDHGLAAPPTIDIATRAGLRPVEVLPDGRFRVGMGPVTVGEPGISVWPSGVTMPLAGIPADVGNPHAVSFVDDLAALRLYEQPDWAPKSHFPNGVNLEFVQRMGPQHIAMRVYERGSGETRSCGTGTCAAAAVAAAEAGEARPIRYRVEVPGGTVEVELGEVELGERQCFLTGPAVIVADGTVALP